MLLTPELISAASEPLPVRLPLLCRHPPHSCACSHCAPTTSWVLLEMNPGPLYARLIHQSLSYVPSLLSLLPHT